MATKTGKTQKIHTLRLQDLTGGINLEASPDFINDNEAQMILNMEFDPEGAKLRTRRGLGTAVHKFNSPVVHVYSDYELNDYIVFLKDKSIYKYEWGQEPKLIGVRNGENERPCCTKFGGAVLIASGDKLQKYDYNTFSVIEGSPKADIVFTRAGRVVVSKTGSDLLIYSAIGDETSWEINSNDASARKDVNVGYKDGGDILGVGLLASDIIVFKSNGLIYDVQNEPEDWNILQIGDNSDFSAQAAVTNINNDIVYLSSMGLRSVSSSQSYGNFEKGDIGKKINPALRGRQLNPYISTLKRTKQLVVPQNNRTELFVYHYGLKAFTKWKFPQPVVDIVENQWRTIVVTNGNGTNTDTDDANSGYVYEFTYDHHTDMDNKISQSIVSKELRDTHKMNLYRSYLDVEPEANGSGNITVNDVVLTHQWTDAEKQHEFKTQISSPILKMRFDTSDPIIYKYISFDVVMQNEAIVRQNQSSSSGRRSRSGDFLKDIKKKANTPYG